MSERLTEREYYSELQTMADELVKEVRSGDYGTGEQAREWLIETVHERIDRHQYVIYTAYNQELLAISNNDGAYVENFGPEGLVRDGRLNWAAMAYAAMEQDLWEVMGRIEDFDMNDPNPEPEPADDEEDADAPL